MLTEKRAKPVVTRGSVRSKFFKLIWRKPPEVNGMETVSKKAKLLRKPLPWTVVEERRAEELYKTMTAREVAGLLGRTKQSVENRLFFSKTAVTKKGWQRWTVDEDDYLMTVGDKTASRHLNRSACACKSRRLVLKQLAKTAEGDSK